jgi:hypothetical protein
MANFIVLDLARDPDNREQWFFTGRSFIAASTAKTVDEIVNSDFYPTNFNRQCDAAFGTWESVEILPFPNTSNKPTLVKVLDQALPLTV